MPLDGFAGNQRPMLQIKCVSSVEVLQDRDRNMPVLRVSVVRCIQDFAPVRGQLHIFHLIIAGGKKSWRTASCRNRIKMVPPILLGAKNNASTIGKLQ